MHGSFKTEPSEAACTGCMTGTGAIRATVHLFMFFFLSFVSHQTSQPRGDGLWIFVAFGVYFLDKIVRSGLYGK